MDNTELGAQLKKAREEKGLTQREVIEKLGIPKVQTLSAYERGVNATPLDTLKKLAELYGVSTDWILFGKEYVSRKEKTLRDYLEQLIESVEALQLDLCSLTVSNNDPYDESKYGAMCIVLNSHIYPGLEGFAEEWRNLRVLRDNGTIDADDYDTLIKKRISKIYGQFADDFSY